ncbi:hypothetical protein CEXT_256461 [Caerostris extrusa]|uniref:Uncharacterized protein n=1 Tax=Caerostris extrusa TaxID=172846 RepID=A0AAV4QS67_CAEEX|nr:hypothetical protein CEXT_256461 [Caerostris extrusa]
MKTDFATRLPSLATSHRNLILVPGYRRYRGSELFVYGTRRIEMDLKVQIPLPMKGARLFELIKSSPLFKDKDLLIKYIIAMVEENFRQEALEEKRKRDALEEKRRADEYD